jgi:RNA polymerase sigma factor (sigma-70 family)
MVERVVQPLNGFDREFIQTYERLFSLIFRIAYRITGDIGRAEDVCHETFIKYYERGKPLPDMNQAKYWLIRVVKNIALNVEKRKTRERKAFARLRKITPNKTISEEEAFLKKETERAVQKALNLLPYKLRVVLVLKEYEGLTYREISSIMGISEGNVKVRVFRAREKLEKIFREREGNVS